MSDALIAIEGVTKVYQMGTNQVHALNNVSLTIARGEFTAVMGPSGSGKSTFLNLLGCLDRPTSGRYVLNGKDVSKLSDDELSLVRSQNLGFVFQSFNLLPKLTAQGNIELPQMYAGRQTDQARTDKLLAMVTLSDRRGHTPSELSGGQQQRVALARSLINAPPVLLADEPTGNLDSATGREIMLILKGLNQAGLTIVVVTHEEEVAAYADRVIRFKDGVVVSDQRRPATDGPVEEVPPLLLPSDLSQYSARRTGVSTREILENFQSALNSLWNNKLRSFLTALGILIGVGAVIAMVSIGEGAQAQVRAQIEGLGSNLLTVIPGSTSANGPVRDGAGTSPTLTYDDAQALNSVAGIAGIAPELTVRKQVKFERSNWNTTITGTSAVYPTVHNWDLDTGTFFTEEDNATHRMVCVLGHDTAVTLFADQDPLGKTIRIDNFPYKVIGVMQSKGGGGYFSRDDFVLLPLDTAYHKMAGVKNVRSIAVEVTDKGQMQAVQEGVTDLLRTRHKLYSDAGNDFTIVSQDDILQTAQSVTATLTLLLASIAGISLLVGGIGIMNIMLVTVTERTREIGIRKALGARGTDILLQFLIEAVTLSLAGGILGVLFGAVASGLISWIGHTPTSLSLSIVGIALAFSVAVGVFFGIYPAQKASKMDPIQALRFD